MTTAEFSPTLRLRSETHSTIRLTIVRGGVSSAIRSAAEPRASQAAEFSADSYSVTFPAAPLVLSAASRHRAAGIKFLSFSVLALATAGFLVYELPKTPSLKTELIIVAVVSAMLGVAMLHWALRSLLGRLRIDAGGLRWTPGYSGFNIAWKDLRHWAADPLAFHLHTRKSRTTLTIERDLLTLDDQDLLHATLTACVGERLLDGGDRAAR